MGKKETVNNRKKGDTERKSYPKLTEGNLKKYIVNTEKERMKKDKTERHRIGLKIKDKIK